MKIESKKNPHTFDQHKHEVEQMSIQFSKINNAFGEKDKNKILINENQQFLLNNEGCRGDDFLTGNTVLFAGCSLTLGIGLPQEDIWGEILCNKNNFSKSNLSFSGASIVHIVNQIMNYIYKYGKPKILLCLFPSTDRTRWWSDNLITETSNHDDPGSFSEHQHLPRLKEQIDSYIKLPVNVNKIIHAQSAAYYNIFAIRMLEEYCNSNNIFFRWTAWYRSDMIEKINFKNKLSFLNDNINFDFKENKWSFFNSNNEIINCHLEYSNDLYFYKASDTKSGWPHPGKHIQLHISELFEKEIEDYFKNDNFRN